MKKVEYYKFEKIKKDNKDKKIEFKRVIWSETDSFAIRNYGKLLLIEILEGVKEFDEGCFYCFDDCVFTTQISIPSSLTTFPKDWLIISLF